MPRQAPGLKRLADDQKWSVGIVMGGGAALALAAVTDDPMTFLAYLGVQLVSTVALAADIRARAEHGGGTDQEAGAENTQSRGIGGTLITMAMTALATGAMLAAATVAPEALMFATLAAPVAFMIRNALDSEQRQGVLTSTKPRDLNLQTMSLAVMVVGLALMQNMGMSLLGAEVQVDGFESLIALAALQVAMAANTYLTIGKQLSQLGDKSPLVKGAIQAQRLMMVSSSLAQGLAIGLLAAGVFDSDAILVGLMATMAAGALVNMVAHGYRNAVMELGSSADVKGIGVAALDTKVLSLVDVIANTFGYFASAAVEPREKQSEVEMRDSSLHFGRITDYRGALGDDSERATFDSDDMEKIFGLGGSEENHQANPSPFMDGLRALGASIAGLLGSSASDTGDQLKTEDEEVQRESESSGSRRRPRGSFGLVLGANDPTQTVRHGEQALEGQMVDSGRQDDAVADMSEVDSELLIQRWRAERAELLGKNYNEILSSKGDHAKDYMRERLEQLDLESDGDGELVSGCASDTRDEIAAFTAGVESGYTAELKVPSAAESRTVTAQENADGGYTYTGGGGLTK